MTLTLTDTISEGDREFRVTGELPDAAGPGYRFRLDDEMLELFSFGYVSTNPLSLIDRGLWRVRRGIADSIPASHDGGTEVLAVDQAWATSADADPPGPFLGGPGSPQTLAQTLALGNDTGGLGIVNDTTVPGGTADVSAIATAAGTDRAAVTRSAIATGNAADASTLARSGGTGDAGAGVQADASAGTGSGDASLNAVAASGNATATATATSATGTASADKIATSGGSADASAQATADASAGTGEAYTDTYATANAGDASAVGHATTTSGTATAGSSATRGAATAYLKAISDVTNARLEASSDAGTITDLVAALAGVPRVIAVPFTYSQFVNDGGNGVLDLGVTIPADVILQPSYVEVSVAFNDSSNTDIDVTDGAANNITVRHAPQTPDTETIPGAVALGPAIGTQDPTVPRPGDVVHITAPIPLFARLLGWAQDGTTGTATLFIEYAPIP